MATQIILARPPLHKEVADILTKRIAAGELPKNSYLPPERELCKNFGVSRTVIREAIKLLESHGMVQVKRGDGTVVTDAQEKHISSSLKGLIERKGHLLEQLMEIRSILEVAVVGLAAERRTTADIAAMKRSLQLMKDNPGESVGYVDADVQFHYNIARAAHNPLVMVLIEPVSDLLRSSREKSFSGVNRVTLRTKQHEGILRMIEERNAEGARFAMASHLRDTMDDLVEHSNTRRK
jgi:GntR family transcriptional repressor for pyruvate dehydrogenase complex